jgi:serine/threonine protein kinase
MLTKSGVKVLDFGLAKVARAVDAGDQTVTLQGTVLGSPRYMSPEQAQGKEAGVRSDIFSFGVVLHEMLTGQQLFERETTSKTLAAVLKEEPDLTRVPVKVRRLQACLQKDSNQRLQAIGDAWLQLEDVPERVREAKSRVLWAIAGAFAIVAGIALAGWWRAARPAERALQPLVRLDVDL